jgi:uncharacterized cofD-like protein
MPDPSSDAPGPAVVALGGGHGLATALRAIRRYAGTITAVVSVADDGGSSGKLRTELGLPPVGDIRNCIVALADAEPLMGQLLQYRFPGEEGSEGLGGHAIGNLLIAAMTALTSLVFTIAMQSDEPSPTEKP